MYRAKVYITPKEGILDPQGAVVKKALNNNLGYKNVVSVKVGKFIQLELDGHSREEVLKQVDEMSIKLLSNPIIESYTFEIEEITNKEGTVQNNES